MNKNLYFTYVYLKLLLGWSLHKSQKVTSDIQLLFLNKI
ncbi:hypothetical protein J624_0350 [Acinetobacter baumannii 1062314]|nr:hypothetical protein J624_0350 [Acinetobacter baumannii 1062314]